MSGSIKATAGSDALETWISIVFMDLPKISYYSSYQQISQANFKKGKSKNRNFQVCEEL